MYQQGLNENPVYVPRKIRHDKYIVLTADELEILQRREINELKSEIELFKLREERNRKKVELQDDLVSIFVTEQVQNPYLKEAILRAWNEKNLKEMERVTDVWRGKVNGMIKAYEKDKEFIRRHNQNRIKEQNSNTSRQVLNPRGNLEDNSLLVRNENPEGVIQNNSGQFRNRNIVTAQENDSPLALEDTREAAEEEEISRQGEIEMISQIDTMPNRSPSSAPVIDVDIEDQGSNLNTILTAETIPSSQRAIHRSSIDLEEVESKISVMQSQARFFLKIHRISVMHRGWQHSLIQVKMKLMTKKLVASRIFRTATIYGRNVGKRGTAIRLNYSNRVPAKKDLSAKDHQLLKP